MPEKIRQTQSEWQREEAMRVFLSIPQLALYFWRIKWRIAFTAVFFGLLAISYASIRPVSYEVQASFSDLANSHNRVELSGGSLSLEEPSDMDKSHIGPITLMRSRTLLESLVRKLNLQAALKPKREGGFVQKLAGIVPKIQRSLGIEVAQYLKDPSWIPQAKAPQLTIKEIDYAGNTPLPLSLRFVTDKEFLLFDEEELLIGQGKVGIPYRENGLAFTLEQDPSVKLSGRSFHLKIFPMWQLVKTLREDVVIIPDPDVAELYTLSTARSNPELASTLLNELIQSYIDHIKAEAQKKASEKLAFLETRRQELVQQLEEYLTLNEAPSSIGEGPEKFLDYETQASVLSTRQEELEKAQTALDLRLQSLDGFLEHGYAFFPETLKEIPEIDVLLTQARNLEQQRDTLNFDLQQAARQGEAVASTIDERATEIDRTERKVKELSALITALDRQNISLKTSLKDPLVPPSKRDSKDSPFLDHLKNAKRQHEIRSKVLRSQLAFEQIDAPDFSGLNLTTATRLYEQSHGQLDQKLAELQDLGYAIEHLDEPLFSISSLSGTLGDPVSTSLISEASAISDKLANEEYYTNKEIAYFKAFLSRKKDALKAHVLHRQRATAREAQTLRAKVKGLQTHMLGLINKDLAVIEQQVDDIVLSKKDSVIREKRVVDAKLGELEEALQQLPDKWAAEQEWRMQKQLNGDMTKALTEMVEAINISQNIATVDARVVEAAIPPALPKPTRLFRYAVLGLVWGFFLAVSSSLGAELIRGFRVTPRVLEALGGTVAGVFRRRRRRSLSENPEVIEAFRRALAQAPELEEDQTGRALLLLKGQAKDLEPSMLVRLLALKGQSVLVIKLPVTGGNSPITKDPLIQYLEGSRKRLQPSKQPNHELIGSGAASPFAAELIDSKNFKGLVERSLKTYDTVLLVSGDRLDSLSSQILAQQSDQTIVVVSGERLPALQPFLDLDQRNGAPQVSFIFNGKS